MSRRDDDEHAGYSTGNPFRRRHPDADDSPSPANEIPVDLAAVQADDALLDMLGGNAVGRSAGDADLAQVLVAWRRDIDTESIGELVDTDTALAAISAGRRPAHRRHPVLGPVAAAAAVLVIAFSGVGLVAKSAQPEDQLWSLTKVLYADYARSVETAQRVKAQLQDLDKAIDEGKTTPAQARESLKQVEAELAVVDDAQGYADLATKRQQLEEKLDYLKPAEPGPPPAPAPQLPPEEPVVPMPPDPATTTTVPEPSTPEPTVRPTDPTTPTDVPIEPEPRTSEPSPRASPPVAATGSTPPVTGSTGSTPPATGSTSLATTSPSSG